MQSKIRRENFHHTPVAVLASRCHIDDYQLELVRMVRARLATSPSHTIDSVAGTTDDSAQMLGQIVRNTLERFLSAFGFSEV